MFAVGRSGWRYEKFYRFQAEPVKVLRLGRFWMQWEQSKFSKSGTIKQPEKT
jgi:hypothetical protein